MKGKTIVVAVVLLVAIWATGPVLAGEMISPVAKAPVAAPVEVESDWDVDVWLDGWLTQASMRIQGSGPLMASPRIFLSFGDLIQNLDWIVPIGADIRYKRIGFIPDLYAAKISGGGSTPEGSLFTRASVGMKLSILNLAGYYRLLDEERFSVDVIGGARYLYLRQELALSGGRGGAIVGGTASSETTSKVWDGVVGARVAHQITDRLYGWVYGDVGAGGSDLTWQVWANLGYQVTDSMSVLAGYRYQTWEGGNETADASLTLSGPVVTVNWSF
ncbi:MAG: hypothetical protein AAF591_14785 [Verrucomicrobiota bacterium]